MALTADSKQLYIPLSTIYGNKGEDGNYNLSALDIKAINDNLFYIAKKIQGNLTLSDLTDLAVRSLTATTVITQNLYATYGDIAELTVDRLLTLDKVARYWDSDTSDANYISIQEQFIKFITGTTDGSTTQHTNRNGDLLYYNGAATAETYKDVGMTTTETDYPVIVYEYTEYPKMELSFTPVGDNYEVDWILGSGTGTGDNGKAKFHKDTTGINLTYYEETTGNERTMRLDNNDIKCIGNTGTGFNLRNIAITDDNLMGSAQNGDLQINPNDYTRYDTELISTTTTLTESGPEVIFANGTFDITLHTASTPGIIKKIYNVGSGTITVKGTINSTTDMTLSANASVELITDGTGWRH